MGWFERGYVGGRRSGRRGYYGPHSTMSALVSLIIILLAVGGLLLAMGMVEIGVGLLVGGVVILGLTIWYGIAKRKKRKQQAEQKPIEKQD